ncbi:MAG: 3-deoxy-7-phosphoheptulonate synthase [Ignavibacteria bacterium]|nr:3-deoxy-7-phosphoheptulonate synthase [Ignavibacteria bacterium]
MLVLMPLNAPREHIESVKSKLLENDCKPHEIPGLVKLGIGVTGPTNKLRVEDFQTMDSVDEVVRVTKPFKLVSREMKKEDTTIQVGSQLIGGKKLTIIAGPCSVESKDQILEISSTLKEVGVSLLRAGAFKPRSSPYAFQGLKSAGLQILADAKKELGMSIVTEVKDTDTLDEIAAVADIIQIGARNMQNFSLLERIGELRQPVLLKRGLSATIEELLMSAEYIMSQGNYQVILCERGIRTFETYTRNTLDLNAIPVIKQLSHLPVIVDPSHGIGIADKVPAMALAGVACGGDGVIVEVHPHPELALSDGFQSLTPKNFKEMIGKIRQLAPIVGKEI